jgi:hypothetical protein
VDESLLVCLFGFLIIILTLIDNIFSKSSGNSQWPNKTFVFLFFFFKYILCSFILFNYLSFRGNTCDNHKSLSSAKMTKILSFESRNDSNTYFLDLINPNLSSEYQKCSSSILPISPMASIFVL